MVDGPKYVTIASALRARIDDGEFVAGDRLPAQHALADEYGVTLMTLRQALADLERDGLVHAVRGTGTFVSEQPTVRLGLDHLWSFAQEMAHQGTAIQTEVIEVTTEPDSGAASQACAALGLGESDVVEVVRRRAVDGVPVVVQRSVLPIALWRAVGHVDLTTTSLYEALRDHAAHDVERASETFRAVAAPAIDAELLGVPAGTACLESVRVSFTATAPFLHDRAVLLGSAASVTADRTASTLRLGYAIT